MIETGLYSAVGVRALEFLWLRAGGVVRGVYGRLKPPCQAYASADEPTLDIYMLLSMLVLAQGVCYRYVFTLDCLNCTTTSLVTKFAVSFI